MRFLPRITNTSHTMHRRHFIESIPAIGALTSLSLPLLSSHSTQSQSDREYWISMLTKIARPVLTALSNGTLKKTMPVETLAGAEENRRKVTYLEALGRTLAGLAPWLELGPDNTAEGKLRQEFITLSTAAIKNSVDPSSPDLMNFREANQPLVDAAFLAHALLSAPV